LICNSIKIENGNTGGQKSEVGGRMDGWMIRMKNVMEKDKGQRRKAKELKG
jgi:hypothetical protein